MRLGLELFLFVCDLATKLFDQIDCFANVLQEIDVVKPRGKPSGITY